MNKNKQKKRTCALNATANLTSKSSKTKSSAQVAKSQISLLKGCELEERHKTVMETVIYFSYLFLTMIKRKEINQVLSLKKK